MTKLMNCSIILLPNVPHENTTASKFSATKRRFQLKYSSRVPSLPALRDRNCNHPPKDEEAWRRQRKKIWKEDCSKHSQIQCWKRSWKLMKFQNLLKEQDCGELQWKSLRRKKTTETTKTQKRNEKNKIEKQFHGVPSSTIFRSRTQNPHKILQLRSQYIVCLCGLTKRIIEKHMEQPKSPETNAGKKQKKKEAALLPRPRI